MDVGVDPMLGPSYRGTEPVTDDLDQAVSQPAIATPSGRIDIDEDAIAAIVRDVVRSRYGVVAIGRPRRGSPIATVARKVIETVTFQIKRTLGIGVDRVDVNIGGLRLSDCAAGSLA